MPSKIRIGKAEHTIIIVDISMNGTKIQHSEIINQQGKLHIELDGTWYSGKIKWTNKLFAGVKFERSISLQTFNAVLQAA